MRFSSNPCAPLPELQSEDSAWLQGAKRVPSPHCSERANPDDIGLVVLHCISLPEGSPDVEPIHALFQGRLDTSAHERFADLEGVRVSAHLLIDREGAVYQYVPFNKAAWHAGESSWRGRRRCNDFSIGIELQGSDDLAFEEAQYQTLQATLRSLLDTYPRLGMQSLAGHCHIAPQRKTDPGVKFDWARVSHELAQEYHA